MFCKNCGTELAEGSKFCQNCGTMQEEQTAVETAGDVDVKKKATQYSKNSIAGFVLSLCGIFVFPIVCGIIGVVFSARGLKETAGDQKRGRGLAIAGLIISIASIVYGIYEVIVTIYAIVVLGEIFDSFDEYVRLQQPLMQLCI